MIYKRNFSNFRYSKNKLKTTFIKALLEKYNKIYEEYKDSGPAIAETELEKHLNFLGFLETELEQTIKTVGNTRNEMANLLKERKLENLNKEEDNDLKRLMKNCNP